MTHEQHSEPGVIELGAATVETKGPVGIPQDERLGRNGAGLSDD